jgi:hypothetical protein
VVPGGEDTLLFLQLPSRHITVLQKEAGFGMRQQTEYCSISERYITANIIQVRSIASNKHAEDQKSFLLLLLHN